MGNPRTITWYYNKTAVSVYTNQTGNLTEALKLETGINNRKNGEYYAVVVNEDGNSFISNTITLVYDELPIELGEIAISDDYKNAKNMVLNARDNKAVVTITMKKAYSGTFYLYEDKITNYSTTNATTAIYVNADLVDDTTNGYAVKTADKLTEKNAIDNWLISYVHENGETTIMWAPNSNKIVRGKSYKVVFDQDALDSDDITATGRKDVKATASALAAYVTAPASIELVTTTAGSAGKLNILDADGKVMEFIGDALNPIVTVGGAGFASVKVFGETAAKASTKVAGQFASVKGGVVTTTALADYAYYQAELKTVAGVYGEKAITLTSGFKAKNVGIASKVKVAENGSTPAQADITLEGVVGNATVYVTAAGDEASNGTFDADDPSTYRGSVNVKAGDSAATIANVFAKEDIGDTFTAWIVPENEETFGRLSSEGYKLPRTATSLEYSDTLPASTQTAETAYVSTLAANNLVIKDQFGQGKEETKQFTAIVDKKAAVTVSDAGGSYAEKAEATFSVTPAGGLSVTLTRAADSVGVNIGDGFDVSVLGSTVKYRAATLISTNAATATDYTITDGDHTLVAGAVANAITVNTYTDLRDALAAAASDKDTNSVITVGQALIIPAGQTITVAAGDTLALGTAKTTNNGTINIAGTLNTVADGDILGTGTFKLSGTSANNQLALTELKAEQTNNNFAVEIATDTTLTAATVMAAGGKFVVDADVTFDTSTLAFTSVGLVDVKGEFKTGGTGTVTVTGGITFEDGSTANINAAKGLTVGDGATVTVKPNAEITSLVFGAATANTGRNVLSDGTYKNTFGASGASDVTTGVINETNGTKTMADSKKITVTRSTDEETEGLLEYTIA